MDFSRLLEAGWWLFPLEAGGKTPLTSSGFHAASNDPRMVADWWRVWPDANIGVATGPSGLLVVDCDTAKGETPPSRWRQSGVVDGLDVFALVCERHGLSAFPDTYSVATPSSGRHFYFTVGDPVPCSSGRIGWRVDVRADGGYVVGAGSHVGDKPYQLLDEREPQQAPAWLVDLAQPPAPDPRWQRATTPEPRRSDRYARVALELETAAVAAAANGVRNDTLNRAAFALARLVANGSLDEATMVGELTTAAHRNGLDPRETQRTIGSALRARGRGA